MKLPFLSLLVALAPISHLGAATEYVVAIADRSAADAGWKNAADALAAKHHGKVAVWDETEIGLARILWENEPRYLAIVGEPKVFDSAVIRGVNRATRMANPDPWTDCRWGLITGATSDDALRLIQTSEPLVVKRALCTTGIELAPLESALVLSDGKSGKYTRKEKGGQPQELTLEKDAEAEGTVGLFAEAWSSLHPQLFVTSSHATQGDLQMPFELGCIVNHAGNLYTINKESLMDFLKTRGGDPRRLAQENGTNKWFESHKPAMLPRSDEPKVWLAAGNCLIGDAAKTSESMVVTALSCAGVRQMLGYVVPTWYGKNGWGALQTWQSSDGRLTMSEAFFLNTQKLINRTIHEFPGAEKINFDSDEIDEGLKNDRKFGEGLTELMKAGVIKKSTMQEALGLIHDRDVVAFWGDPCWDARIAAPEGGSPVQVRYEDLADGGLKMELEASRDFEGEWSAWLPKRIPKPVLKMEKQSQAPLAAKDFVYFDKLKLSRGEKLAMELQPGK